MGLSSGSLLKNKVLLSGTEGVAPGVLQSGHNSAESFKSGQKKLYQWANELKYK